MVNIMILFVAFLVVTATVGVQLFAGDFLNRCALTSSLPEDFFTGDYGAEKNLYGRMLVPDLRPDDLGNNGQPAYKTFQNGIKL